MPKHHSRGLTPVGRVLCWAVHEPLASAGASVAVGRAAKCLGSAGRVKASGLYLRQMTAALWISPAFNFQGVRLNHSTWLGWPGPLLVSPASGSLLFIPLFLHPVFLCPSL